MKLFSAFLAASPPSDPIARALADAPTAAPSSPWRDVGTFGIGGLTALGFARASETLLLCSANGQSVMDAGTGEMSYRNREDDGLDIAALKGTRLDHPADERFDMAGLYGGALRSVTDDGWTVGVIGHGDRAHCLLQPPGASIHNLAPALAAHGKDATFVLLARELEEVRAFGFSWTGRSLVLATPSQLRLWSRPAPLSLQ